MTSHYGQYIAEREGRDIIEDEFGFATYIMNADDGECYIVDIYVVPEMRKAGIASKYADTIAEIARLNGCDVLSGSVDPTCENATDSLKVLLGYGMNLVFIGRDGLIYFKKDL